MNLKVFPKESFPKIVEEEIIYKLKEFLNKHMPMDEECHVVYLLVQIRKLLERKNIKKIYPILCFYCNWLVHPCKDRDNQAIVEIMERVDKSIINEHKFPDLKIFIPSDDSSYEFMYFKELIEELKKLFDELSLPLCIFENDNWASFRDLLIQILIDQPIKKPTNNIDSVCFLPVKKGAIHLLIEFNDGRGSRRFLNTF